ncbi:TOPLESS-related 3 [Theobroma cacao]|uniref:TOPLESS-related 3 n=1 Tax=Theobroma cacao TaxID=3641 RepID=A0A061F2L3_THECC|nr:TOPLESS-related 3 [Theobroma cacao]
MHQGSTVTSMDFHPSQHTLLLVGSANAEITLWELGMRKRFITKSFKIWDMAACSMTFQGLMVNDTPISVKRVTWSPDGSFVGVSFSKHLIHLYAYPGSNDLIQHLEIDAHVGGVNDLAFAHPNKQLYIVTCGDDKLIKLIYSTAVDGTIILWLYNDLQFRADFVALGHGSTTMLYSADGSRLFTCGTSKDGQSYLAEWYKSQRVVKRIYTGFGKKSAGVVSFDTTQNQFLAAGEDSQIKFWHMDNSKLLTFTDAEGGLPSLPRVRFNKEGNLLAVTIADNGFKILANDVGLRSLKVVDDAIEKTKPWQLAEIVDPLQCRLVNLPDSTDTSSKVVRLLYTNSGFGILALGSNGVQKLWKWPRNEQNPSGEATANVVPQHWQPNSGLLMTNDVSGVNLEEAVPCITLSKNDLYVMSATGGKVSLFNMMTFKVMATFLPPPPASTFLAFHPQNKNIIAIGMDDSSIYIYNVQVDKMKSKLRGHQKRITGLAFSTSLNILVSSGADAHSLAPTTGHAYYLLTSCCSLQLCVWSIFTWVKTKSVAMQMPAGKAPTGDTRVQFHSDGIRLLVVHETQLAIYNASKMERVRQWVSQDVLPAPISYATYSCNSQSVYATFCDGNVGVFDADSLRLICRIASSVHLSQAILKGKQVVYPFVVAAHPKEANQFAIGLSDGSVKVMEPTESEGKWQVSQPVDSGVVNGRMTSSSATSNHTPDQLER